MAIRFVKSTAETISIVSGLAHRKRLEENKSALFVMKTAIGFPGVLAQKKSTKNLEPNWLLSVQRTTEKKTECTNSYQK